MIPLLVIIGLAWVGLCGFVVALCRLAARGDSSAAAAFSSAQEGSFLADVVLWREAPVFIARDMRPAEDYPTHHTPAPAGRPTGR